MALHAYEVWPPMIREKNGLRVFENGVLRRTFG
jgi:hypothetical protein